MTIHRRYYELCLALDRLEELKDQFSTPPDVVVVWAQPDVGHLWFFQQLLKLGKIQHLVTRPKIEDEGVVGGITYPESHNLRAGLEWVKKNYGPDTYVIGQAADVRPKGFTYGLVDGWMSKEGKKAVVFWYHNPVTTDGIWHTNFFAVCLEEIYWPPISEKKHEDVLERQWGRHLQKHQPPGIQKSSNYNQNLFEHCHRSEQLPALPVFPQAYDGGLCLTVAGRMSWWRCIFQKIKERVSSWRKSTSNSTRSRRNSK